VEEDGVMGFQDRAYETQLARSAWLLELADHWRDRDPEFAEQLRMKACRFREAEDSAVSYAKRDAP
jgi:hypothetical protein